MNFTETQKEVLQTENKNIIVSASAGTGKTTVMAEKIANLVESGKVKLNELLVVTFTKLAAGEMKKKLKSKLGKSRSDAAQDQLLEIDNCDISTLHGFCASLIRRYFFFAGVDPSFAVLSEEESFFDTQKLMDAVFEELYASKDEKLSRVAQVLGNSRNDTNLKKIVKELYEFKICMPNFSRWLEELEDKYLVKKDGNFYTNQLNKRWTEAFDAGVRQALLIADECFERKMDKLGIFFSELAQKLKLSGNYYDNFDVVKNFSFGTRPQIKKEDADDFTDKLVKRYEKFKTAILEEQKLTADETAQSALERTVNSFEVVKDLFYLALQFEERYTAVKKQKNALDYNDLEHYALKILRNEELRKQIKDNYKLIFVDEFQDTNDVQEEIISLISSPGGLFLVGDVKQSIYAFRQCRPQIFIDTMLKFEKNMQENAVIHMKDNFRSNTDILGFVNLIFDRAMSEHTGGIDYKKTSRLIGSKTAKTKLPAVQLDLVRRSGKDETEAKPSCVYDIRERAKNPELTDAQQEGFIAAQRINELVGKIFTDDDGKSRAIRFSDIAILVRTGKEKAAEICAYLNSANIPAVAELKRPLFDRTELKTLVNLLKVIDNPLQDVPLAACLRGFFGKLTEQELLEIRHEGEKKITKEEKKEVFFHECVFKYADSFENGISQKLKAFFALTDRCRLLAQSAPLRLLLSELIAATDYRLFVAGLPDGDNRCVKLDKFVDSLKGSFFDGSVKQFLDFVQRSEGKETASTGAGMSDAVRVMTIHASKGLEFPVVILCDCGREFNFDDGAVICDKQTGAGAFYYDAKNKVKSNTISRSVIYKNSVKEQTAEEMRLLYVALTRAKNHLYIIGCKKETKDGIKFDIDNPKCFLDWIFNCVEQVYGCGALEVGDRELKKECCIKVWQDEDFKEQRQSGKREFVFAKTSPKNVKKYKEEIEREYPHGFAVSMGLKVSPSRLTHYSENEQDETPCEILFDTGRLVDTGIAYHKIFENINLADKTQEHILEVLKKLEQKGEISGETAKKIQVSRIIKVLENELFAGIEKKKVYRELPFMLKTNAQNFFSGAEGETVFLQGVIDMLILDGNRATVVDFKYSRSAAADIKERYRKQMECYTLAVKEILSIKEVDAYLVSIADGAVVSA